MVAQMNGKVDISRFPMLKDEQRIEAEQIARDNMLARDPEPKRENYNQHAISRVPGWFAKIIVLFVIALFVAGFGPSAFRIFHQGRDTFLAGGEFNSEQGRIAGASFVALAEIAVVLFSMAAGVLSVTIATKRMLYGAAILSALLAIIGNVQVAIDYDATTPFDWLIALVKTLAYNPFAGLEAVLPPVFTLIGGLLLKELVMSAVERRHANEHAYQVDRAAWLERAKDIENQPQWITHKASAIWDVYMRVHKFKKVVKEGVTDDERRAIVAREMLQGQWFDETDLEAYNPVDRPLSSPRPVLGFAQLAPDKDQNGQAR